MAQNIAKKKGWLKIWPKKWVARNMAVKIDLVENMAVNNLWVCNMAEMKYKVENKFTFSKYSN